ncbi:hypothetical protein [Micromonospora sp. NBC_01796]|uniref:hypothetical protein n=1 Tax=Micromonospora sp. NBC_01796 TaxID=2975987 RepID=UPI002DD9F7B8|nr:hypothetical protein [Micromonospora sp. NBC_01796]WSA87858.1 hypothetical protein OIE47_09775 [Micromonospora sp. NBC_01796]
MTSEETYRLAAFVAAYPWTPPAEEWAGHLSSSVATVSECLTQFLPPKGKDGLTRPWLRTLSEAIAAARQAPDDPETINVLAMSVPISGVAELMSMVEVGPDPHPIRSNLSEQVPTPAGTILGFDVLGFSAWLFHSRLCYGLDEQALEKLGIRPNEHGLLASLDEARQVAELTNNKRGEHDGTPFDVDWLPALITQHNPA